MKPVDEGTWFWSPARLAQLLEIMKAVAIREGDVWYFGHEGVSTTVWNRARSLGYDWSIPRVGDGLKMMVFFGILAPGKRGTKSPGYRRPFYPDHPVVLDWDAINRWREHAKTCS